MLGIAWSQSPGSASYELELDGKTQPAKVSPARVLLEDGNHELKIRAVGANGQASAWSDVLRFYFGAATSSQVRVAFGSKPLRCNGRDQSQVEVRFAF